LFEKLIQHYNELTLDNTVIVEADVNKCNKTNTNVFRRVIYNNSINNINYNIIYNLYINIRNIEEDNIFAQSDIDRFIYNSKNIEKKFDRERAIDYINKQFSSTYAAKYGGLVYYKKKFESMED
jgi:hypothetical protein